MFLMLKHRQQGFHALFLHYIIVRNGENLRKIENGEDK